MIVEHALLNVRAGQAAAFEDAMRQAVMLIAASPGFRSIEVRPSAEGSGCYLLLVGWDDIASHYEGFRTSDRYQEWRGLLHDFYDPIPGVSYFGPSIIDRPAAAG